MSAAGMRTCMCVDTALLTSFSAIHCDIRSLNANFDKLTCILTDLNHDFDVIGLSEIKFTRYKEPVGNFQIQNFNFISMSCNFSAGWVYK